MNSFQNNLKSFCTNAVAKQKKKALTAIIMFELSYFNCDQQIAMCDEGAGRDNDNKPPPIPSLDSRKLQPESLLSVMYVSKGRVPMRSTCSADQPIEQLSGLTY